MKPRPSPRRETPARDLMPPDVPEVSGVPSPVTDKETDPIPDDIRRMLEAACT